LYVRFQDLATFYLFDNFPVAWKMEVKIYNMMTF